MRLEDTDELLMTSGYIRRSIELLKKILKPETAFTLIASFGPGTPGFDLPIKLSIDSDVIKESLREWEKLQIIDKIEQLRTLGVDITYESMVQ